MIRINLLAKKVSKKKAGVIQHLSIGAGVILVVLAGMAYGWFVLSGKVKDLNRRIAIQEDEKNRLKNVNEEKTKFERTKDELERKIGIITTLQRERAVPVRLLDELTKVIDNSAPVWIDKYGYASESVTLDGYSLSHEALRPLVDGLERSPYYKAVELLFSERQSVQGREVYRFSIKAAVEQPG